MLHVQRMQNNGNMTTWHKSAAPSSWRHQHTQLFKHGARIMHQTMPEVRAAHLALTAQHASLASNTAMVQVSFLRSSESLLRRDVRLELEALLVACLHTMSNRNT
jgi:hypothetical protein